LAEKYGPYVKPEQNCKGMGATSKKNVASGATAVIRLVRAKGRVLAVKEFKKREKTTESEYDYNQRMQNEYFISKKVSGHINVIDTLDLVKDERDRWCAVMEYCTGGDLFNLLQERPTMSLNEQGCLFKQLLLGLQHIHQLGIAHRDIKPENLVLSEGGTLKIADFDNEDCCARLCHKWCGSEPFWSPEMWQLKNEQDGYDGRAFDIWSAAVTYYCIRTQMLPFRASFYRAKPVPGAKPGSPADVAANAKDGGDEEFGLYCQQRDAGEKCNLWKDITAPEIECLAGMLDPNPKTRFTVEQALETPWMKSMEMCNDGELDNGWRHYH
ncbi:kinase-like domain-containing protein, partial [Phascolomyces articulosus]